jgi:hypothetical protein
MYALQEIDPATNEYALDYGSIGGGPSTKFADISDGTQLLLAGWTSL